MYVTQVNNFSLIRQVILTYPGHRIIAVKETVFNMLAVLFN